MDGTIPRRRLAQVLQAIEGMETTYGLRCANVFHAGDGNLHPLILFDSNDLDEVDRAEKFGAAILELCVEVGGTITGEHGVGLEKINQMCVQFDRDELDTFFGVKRAFDPDGLLNPGQGDPDAGAMRRIWKDARAWRAVAICRYSKVLVMDYALSQLCEQVTTARANLQPIEIVGGGTKRFTATGCLMQTMSAALTIWFVRRRVLRA